MHRIRVITLDLDDTLWAIGPVIERAERELRTWLAARYPRIAAQWSEEAVLRLREDIAAEHADRAHDLRFLRRSVLARMAGAAGYDSDLVDPAFRVFDQARNAVELFPDVLPALDRLAADYALVALTNGNACLETIGIRHYFDDVVTAVDAGVAKPHARIFDVARRRAGARPHEILHVGDHPHLDVVGARDAGLRAAWVNRRASAWPAELAAPDAEIATMAELADLLQRASADRTA
ncbi:MAG: HAD family hydrolase [Woeseiaceae bacterium]|nr:HAD family hydrolase [Woeseiaceae bacterium]